MNKVIVRNIVLVAYLFISVLFPAVTIAKEPQNIDLLKKELIKYHDSGEYYNGIKETILKAKEHLKKCILNNKEGRKLAVVLDIDDTSLSSYDAKNDSDSLFTFDVDFFENVVLKGKWPVIYPVLNLYNFAKENNVAVFFVSGRKESWCDITTKQLLQAGYKNWSGIYLKPDTNKNIVKSTQQFKKLARKDIISRGYDIVLNIGDQYGDLGANCNGCNFKIPNPYYFID
ncbi:conserved hypothetical protein [Gammaproteobacteria bacterium]